MKPFLTSRKNRGWMVSFIIVIAGATLVAAAQPDQPSAGRSEFKPLFNGTNLDGWITRGGKASYEVKDGVIVGASTMKGGGNTFLCTEKEYGDFILELEIKADKEMNSGVQIRSHCFDEETTYDFGSRTIKIPAKRVHGYQVEVDHRPERRWSGGIYEEGRRDWLFPLATNSAAGQAFKFGEWNKYRIQCLGSSIKTWINDVPAADLVDAEALRGFIGLQVHASDKAGLQVHFRNIHLRDLGEQQWSVVWDCSSMDGLEESGPAKWQLKANTVHATQAKEAAAASALVGTSSLMDFTVRLKYKIVKGSFNLTFQPQSGAGFSFPLVERMGTTNFAHVQDWNTVVASVQPTRVVVLLNGHQVKDAATPRVNSVLPGLELPAGSESEVQFKEFEILSPQ